MLITSNLSFSKWDQIFKDQMTTAAAIDRLVHHSIVLELNINSYRLEQSKKRSAASMQYYPTCNAPSCELQFWPQSIARRESRPSCQQVR